MKRKQTKAKKRGNRRKSSSSILVPPIQGKRDISEESVNNQGTDTNLKPSQQPESTHQSSLQNTQLKEEKGKPESEQVMDVESQDKTKQLLPPGSSFKSFLTRVSRWILAVGRFILWPFKSKNWRITAPLLLCVVFIYSYFYFMQSNSTEVSGTISQVGDIEFTFKKFQSEALSPLCGCMRDVDPDEWRGVTFAARYIEIEREGIHPKTGYALSAAMPDKTSWMPTLFNLKGTLYSISLPSDEEFDPRWLLNQGGEKEYQIISKKPFETVDLLMLISDAPLRLALLGDKPIGSWIPADGSKVEIKYESSRRLSFANIASIEETYKPYNPEVDGKNQINQDMGLPLGDFLGPNTVVWSQDGSPVITTGREVLIPNISPQEGKQIVTAFIVTPPFSLRVAVIPLEAEVVTSYIEQMKSGGTPNGAGIPLSYRDSGKVRVSIADPARQAAEFNEVYQRMKQGDLTTTYNNPTSAKIDGKDIGPLAMTFRYPPIPPNKGFNIFGTIDSLKIGSATGNLFIGTRQIPIPAPATLELRNIQSLNPGKDAIPIPLQVEASESKEKLEIRANSEVYLNNKPLNRKSDEYGFSDLAAWLSIAGTLLSAMTAIWSLWKR